MFWFLPELVNALSGLVDVVMALEPVGVACVAVAAAAKAARFCIALRPDRHMNRQVQVPQQRSSVIQI